MSTTTGEAAYQAFKKAGLHEQDVEEFHALALNPKKEIIAHKMLHRGTVDSCLVHPRDLFRFALINNASSVIVAHNHPSGDLLPSHGDLRLTDQLILAGQYMEIPVLDHLILTKEHFSSFNRNRWSNFDRHNVASFAAE